MHLKISSMKNLFYSGIFILTLLSCGKENCRDCTGTVTNTGDSADWTICEDDDGSLTRTNNGTGESTSTSNTLAESVAFFISLGLTCE